MALPPLFTPPAAAADAAILAEITAGLSAGRDLPELLGRFLAPVVRLAGADGGAVRLLDDADDKLHLIARTSAAPQECRGKSAADRHCGFCGSATQAQGAVWAADTRSCRPAAADAPLGPRMLSVPLQHRGRVLGVYNLFFTQRDDAPPADVLALLRSVGELLGLALHSARLESENLRATLLHERQLMAAEVHDSVAQSLAFVKMRLPLLQDAVVASDGARTQRYFDEVRDAVRQAHSGVRGILTQFRAPMDPRGLAHALSASAQSFRRSSGAELEFVNELPSLKLEPELEAQVFHIVQEALNNVARHASAQHARVHLARSGGQIEVRVEDDGTGLPASSGANGGHYGLEIMLERARRLGGTLDVGARPGGGTRVRLVFPAPVPNLAPAPGAAPARRGRARLRLASKAA